MVWLLGLRFYKGRLSAGRLLAFRLDRWYVLKRLSNVRRTGLFQLKASDPFGFDRRVFLFVRCCSTGDHFDLAGKGRVSVEGLA
jgi:hypothetical protein